MLHDADPIDWLLADCGELRLPLLLELQLLRGVRGVAVSDARSLLQVSTDGLA